MSVELFYRETKDARVKMVGETYHARFSCKGVRVQQSLNTKNFKVAVELVNDIQNSILLGENWRKDKALFGDLWEPFLEAKATGKHRGKKIRRVGEKTLKEYIHFGDRWYLPFFGDMRVDKIDGAVWDGYLEYVHKKSRSGAQTKILNHWKYLSGFMNWCRAIGHIRAMPDIYNPDEDSGDDTPGKSLDDETLFKLREGAKGPMRVWILMGQYMGMRSFEISQLPKDRINLKSMFIDLKKTEAKGGRPRKVPLHPEVIPSLTEQIEKHPESPFLFPNRDDSKRAMDRGGFVKPWTKLRQDVGIECVFKDFRSSYATRAFTNPALNPVMVCMALGMSMRVAMKHYIKPNEELLATIPQAFTLSEGKGK